MKVHKHSISCNSVFRSIFVSICATYKWKIERSKNSFNINILSCMKWNARDLSRKSCILEFFFSSTVPNAWKMQRHYWILYLTKSYKSIENTWIFKCYRIYEHFQQVGRTSKRFISCYCSINNVRWFNVRYVCQSEYNIKLNFYCKKLSKKW